MKPIEIIIVDDKKIIRDGLKAIFSRSDNFVIKSEASNGKEAIQLISKNNYDVVIMDINMPEMDGIETTRRIKKRNQKIKILTNSCHVHSHYIYEMLEAGATGFIKKGDDIDCYKEAIWTVNNGGVYLSEDISNETYDKVFNDIRSSRRAS